MRRKLLLLFMGLLIMGLFSGCVGNPPTKIGVKDGSLYPCPSTPNCVSSMSDDEDHKISPIDYEGSRGEALASLKKVLALMGNMEIRQEHENYIWAESTSKFMGFVDDVEFYLPADHQVIHVRSASRIGYSDLGANRKRIEKVRKLFLQSEKSSL